MKKTPVWACVVGLCVAGALSCGDSQPKCDINCSDTTNNVTNNASVDLSAVTLESFPAQYASVYCAAVLRCCERREIEEATRLLPADVTSAQCNQALSQLFGEGYLVQAATEGKLTLDAAASKAALERARDASCDALFVSDRALSAVERESFKGSVADGGACESPLECATPDSSCEFRVCEPPAAVGSSCTSDYICSLSREALYCEEDDTCAAKKALGAACFSGTECLSGACVEEVCAAPQADGQPCEYDDDCDSSICGAESGRCEPRRAAGEECSHDDECISRLCELQDDGTSLCAPGEGPLCNGL